MEEKKKTRRRRIRLLDVFIVLVFLVGICIMLYPAASDLLNQMRSRRLLDQYTQVIQSAAPENYEKLFAEARAYNQRLKGNPTAFSEDTRTPGYEETLRLENTDIMGYVMIEKIRVRLPFYHGTEEDVLQTAIGHLEGTSLPIGEPGDHAVLSAHRGLPSAKLFTDLPELTVGDEFVITVLDREMTYKVDQVLTVLPDSPEAMNAIRLVEGEDLVTLMTCTPYGINSHRLLVRGRRTADRAKEESGGTTVVDNTEAGRSYDRYIPFAVAAAVVIFLILWKIPRKNK